MTALDESLDTMLQHARVALGPRKQRSTIPLASNTSGGGSRPIRRGLMAPPAAEEMEEENRLVRSLLNAADVDQWVGAGGGGQQRVSRHTSPPRSVIPSVEGHDRKHNPTLSRPHTPTDGVTHHQHERLQSPSRNAARFSEIKSTAVYRRGTTEDVLASIVVRGETDSVYRAAQHHEPFYHHASPSPRRGQLGPSVGDRVSGYYSERVGAAAWGTNGDLAIGFDDNDDPVVVVRPHNHHQPTLLHDAVLQPASSSTNSKVASVQSQCLDPTAKPASQHSLLDAGVSRTAAKSPVGSVSSQTATFHSKPLPIPSPDAASSFKDVHHRFINPSSSTFSSPTQPPQPIQPVPAVEVVQVPTLEHTANTPLLDATRGPTATDFSLEEPKDGAVRRPSVTSSVAAVETVLHPTAVTSSSTALHQLVRSQSPREDHGTQTEQQQQQQQPPSYIPPSSFTLSSPNATGSVWALANTEAFVERTPLTPSHQQQLQLQQQLQVLARPRPLPMFTIPAHDDDIQFAGPPQIQQWADDRDPAFVSAVVTHRPGAHRDVIPPSEFRKMIVNGTTPPATTTDEGWFLPPPPPHVTTAAATTAQSQQQPANISTSRSASVQPLVIPTYHTYQEEFPAPPPPPTPKAKTSCGCCSIGQKKE
ncbi:Hypothetical protein, putative [Bodo saltans]|uniref:Uncharacterized protein n=1 Tax=Bodo saltans TaxID=75058 RepID=A0A0S4JVX6_BODSA|nr:Hypothetical protein, putative [Bodo saltans]|eukprot:CUG94457.1 Hypothetical protein, putative [Bodo saltans]